MGFNYGNLAFQKLESGINVGIQFSFRNVHYKSVSSPLGTHRLNEKEMANHLSHETSSSTVPFFLCFSQVYSFNSVRVISWDSYTLLEIMSEHFPACVRRLNSVKSSGGPHEPPSWI